MTERIYYTDAYRTAFEATVTAVDAQSARTTVCLDTTAFYPTTGGQPFDTGRLQPLERDRGTASDIAKAGGVAVVDVVDEAGEILHVIEGGGRLHVGQRVRGTIDWARRFDHMQQHTGQHVLSAAFVRRHGAPTVSFHLGVETCTIDLSRQTSREQIAAAETEANQIVWDDRPVAIRFVTPEEAAALPLRKEPSREGMLRLIDIEGFDLSACGGTHVARTGAIGLIAVLSWEKFKGGQRIEFLCGGRALERLHRLRDAMASTVPLLSVLPTDVPAAVERLQAELKSLKRSVGALQQELSAYRARSLAAAGESTSKGMLVCQMIDGDAATLKSLASAVVSEPGRIAILTSQTSPALVVVAVSAGVACEANHLIAALIGRFGGRGGGKRDLAQAGGLDAPPPLILDEARRLFLA
jgi:alanyl-tRNA synthetase